MDMLEWSEEPRSGAESKSRCVVRLKTSVYADARGLCIKKSLQFLRRQCRGFNLLEEDVGQIGANGVVWRITNLADSQDGIYEVVACNESRDWETGHVDDYDYTLVAYTPEGSCDGRRRL